MSNSRNTLRRCAPLLLLLVLLAGCTGVCEYLHNGCKVGHNYKTPCAPVAKEWIDASDKRVRTDCNDLAGWWTVFNDPLLNDLIGRAYRQNLTLREAGYRVLAARAQVGIATGEFFPQTQDATGSYRRIGAGRSFFDQWNFNFNLSWELDFWGRFRRAIQSAEDTLDASVFDYDDAIVTLLSDTATDYVAIRTTQERIRLLDVAIHVQEDVLNFIEARLNTEGGVKGITEIDRAQARSNLEQSRAQRNQFVIDQRTAENQLCILLGIPVTSITDLLGSPPKTSIPIAPNTVVVGIPADLLRRRPDVRRAERLAAAQAEQIGIAETDWYPAITVSGTLGWQARNLSQLFTPESFNSSVGPSFQWNLLNYGRILNNVRLQDAQFRGLVVAYQNTVLQADLEVENGIVTFLQAHERAHDLRLSVDEAWVALQVLVAQYQAGLSGIDFNRYATIQQTLITQQDQWALARGQICTGLIQVYRGLGGGWQIKCGQDQVNVAPGAKPTGAGTEPADKLAIPESQQPSPPTNPKLEMLPPPDEQEPTILPRGSVKLLQPVNPSEPAKLPGGPEPPTPLTPPQSTLNVPGAFPDTSPAPLPGGGTQLPGAGTQLPGTEVQLPGNLPSQPNVPTTGNPPATP
ncbi:MAG TPA: efflux transporter outer membrane subunit [Lacipirellulaceae bacterium]